MLVFHVNLYHIDRIKFDIIPVLLGKVSGDITPNITRPIMPSNLVYVFYNESENILAGLNPLLAPSRINDTCSTNFECRHDYIIQINEVSGNVTASSLNLFQESKTTLGKILL